MKTALILSVLVILQLSKCKCLIFIYEKADLKNYTDINRIVYYLSILFPINSCISDRIFFRLSPLLEIEDICSRQCKMPFYISRLSIVNLFSRVMFTRCDSHEWKYYFSIVTSKIINNVTLTGTHFLFLLCFWMLFFTVTE